MLDYYGFSYEVVEVNPVTRSQIKFSTDYKKVSFHTSFDSSGKNISFFTRKKLQTNHSRCRSSASVTAPLCKSPLLSSLSWPRC